jgi:hypothetical protein
MSSLRPFVESDIPQVADLHRRVFVAEDAALDGRLDEYRRYFSEVFLNTALHDDLPASLVYERDGHVRGFLGVMLRRMLFNGKPVSMAVCSQFAVDPAERGQVGLRMLKQCFHGPQDLTITDEAGDDTRRIWEWCGGDSLHPHSIRWMRPLRPAQLGLSKLAERTSSIMAGAAAPEARIADAILSRLLPPSFRLTPPRGSRAELDRPTFLACLPEIAGGRSLFPAYDERSAAWAFARASRQSPGGRLRRLVVRNENADVSGWFVYSLGRDRIADVLQLAARPDSAHHVLDHLFDDAMQQGAVAAAGRLEPALVPALSEKRSLFYHGHHWTLLHSRNSELRAAIHRGDAFLSRLEGEWCLRFH